jgi:hypothetical protein
LPEIWIGKIQGAIQRAEAAKSSVDFSNYDLGEPARLETAGSKLCESRNFFSLEGNF